MKDIELLGNEVFALLYRHYDREGNLVSDLDDVLFCSDKEISKDRVSKLKLLLEDNNSIRDVFISIEAAKLLGAWGIDVGIDYFENFIKNRFDTIGNLSPHRVYGYDCTYEEILDSLLNYYVRLADRTEAEGEIAFEKILPLLKSIIELSKLLPFSLLQLINYSKEKNWHSLESSFDNCLQFLIESKNSDSSTKRKILELNKVSK